MMRELIELAIENDAMLVLKRTGYIMEKIRAASECDLGAPLDEADVQLLYITGKAKKLNEMERYYALMLMDKFRIEFTTEVLRLIMLHGAEKAGEMLGAADKFAAIISAYFEARCGTKRKAG